MYDRYLVKERSLHNEVKDGKTVGFAFQVHIGDYRGCFVSLVRGYYINVDGVEYPLESQRFEINGKAPRTYGELAKCCWEYWDYDEWATIHVEKEGGLSAGEHDLTIMQGVMSQYGWAAHDQEWIDNPPDPREMGGKQDKPYVFKMTVE